MPVGRGVENLYSESGLNGSSRHIAVIANRHRLGRDQHQAVGRAGSRWRQLRRHEADPMKISGLRRCSVDPRVHGGSRGDRENPHSPRCENGRARSPEAAAVSGAVPAGTVRLIRITRSTRLWSATPAARQRWCLAWLPASVEKCVGGQLAGRIQALECRWGHFSGQIDSRPGVLTDERGDGRRAKRRFIPYMLANCRGC